MLPKLKLFYMNCMLPEIFDARLARGMQTKNLSLVQCSAGKNDENSSVLY
jgi:hypothetical protein